MLDKQKKDIGYVLGRFWQVCVWYLGRDKVTGEKLDLAVTDPPHSFKHEWKRLETELRRTEPGPKRTLCEKYVAQIMNLFEPTTIPENLTLHQQCDFYLGYYHQMSDIFRSREINSEASEI